MWDKAATIRFKTPGPGRVTAEFRLSDQQIEQIRREATVQGKTEPTFMVQIKDEAGEVVAEVEKLIYVGARHPEN